MNQPHTDLSLDGRAREPSPSAGTDSAGEPPGVSRILRQDQQERLPLLAGKRVVYRERWQNAIDHVCFFTIFISFVCWFFTAPLSFLHIVCILCIIAFGASSFYSFLYQKCTTLYHILNNYNEVCFLFSFVFQKGKRCKLWEDWKAALFFMYMFLQDVETACSFELHLSIHWDCIHLSCTATDRTHGFKEVQYLYKAHPSIVCRYATFSFWTCTGYYLYSVVSLLHVHSLLHTDFLNTENRHQFEEVQSFV